jgi:chromosome segregation ATPase
MQYDTFNSLMDTPLEWDEFARKLERERDEAREQRDGLRSGIDYASDRLTTVTEQRDRLTEALEYILGIGLTEKTRAKAEKALQSLTNNQND